MPEQRLREVGLMRRHCSLLVRRMMNLDLQSHALDVYERWYEADQSVEIHLFAKGGHGFGKGRTENNTGFVDRAFFEMVGG